MNETVGVEELEQLRTRLASTVTLGSDEERLAAVGLLEDIKNVAAAAQAQITHQLITATHVRLSENTRTKLGDAERICAADIAQARRESPNKGRRLVGLSRTLCTQMTHTFAAMKSGKLSEWRAMLIAGATTQLSDADRARLDAEIAGQLDKLGDHELRARAAEIAYRLDPEAFVNRARKAAADRHVSVRPAPDSMAYLTALLPMPTAVACFAALKKHADTTAACGDAERPDPDIKPRSHSQVMADELARRLTCGAIAGHDENGTPVRRAPDPDQPSAELTIEFAVVMTDEALFHNGDEPADIVGFGPIPAQVARDLLLSGHSKLGDRLRRLYRRPRTKDLIAMESRARLFPEYLKRFVLYRDKVCRTPYCGAPIRHIDHIQPAAAGGATSAANAQGLCVNCNLTKALQDGSATMVYPPLHGPVLAWSA